MSAVFRFDNDDEHNGTRTYIAKGGGETTDRKKAQKHRGCCDWHPAIKYGRDGHRWFCDCGR